MKQQLNTKKNLRHSCLPAGRRIISHQSGFSLLEVLTILSVMTMLTTFILTYSRTGENQINLFQEQAKAVNLISRAKNLAIETYLDESRACGFGVHIDVINEKLIIFRDKAEPCGASDNKYTDSQEDFEVFTLNSKLEFGNVEFDDVLFIPPDPITIFDGNKDKKGEFVLSIKIRGSSDKKEISVNNAGQITIK